MANRKRTAEMQKRIVRHGEQILAIFPYATIREPVALCKRLRRIETRANHAAEQACNDQAGVDAWENESEKAEAAVQKVLGVGGERVWVNADPRGYALKIDLLPERECPDCQRGFTPSKQYLGNYYGLAERCTSGCDVFGILPAESLHTDWGGYGIIAPDLS